MRRAGIYRRSPSISSFMGLPAWAAGCGFMTTKLTGITRLNRNVAPGIVFALFSLFLVLSASFPISASQPVESVPHLPIPEPVFAESAVWFPEGSWWERGLTGLERPELTRALLALDDILPGRSRETLLRARALRRAGETVKAESLFSSLTRQNHTDETRALAFLELGESYFQQEKWSDTVKALIEAINLLPDYAANWRIHFTLGIALEADGEHTAAVEAYRNAAAGAPAKSRLRAVTLRRAGWLLAVDRNLNESDGTGDSRRFSLIRELWQRALFHAENYPPLADSLSLDMAELFFSQGHFDLTRDLLAKPLQRESRGYRWEFLAGRAALEVSDLDSTRVSFERLIAKGARVPSSWLDEARVVLGWIALKQGSSEEALGYYRNVSGDRLEDLPPSVYGTAVALISQAAYGEAESRLTPAPPVAQTDPLFYPWLYALAYSRFHIEKYGQAINDLESFRGLTHADSLVRAAWSLKGDCYYRLSQPEDAFAAYNKAVNILPSAPELLERRRALAAIATESWGAAARLLGDLIVKYPGTEYGGEYHFWRAEVFYRLGRMDSARDHYKLAERFGADPVRCAYALGWCDYKEADFASALANFDVAAALCADCAYKLDLFMRRGNCLYNTGDIAGSATAFAEAVEFAATGGDVEFHNRAAYRYGWALIRLQDFAAAEPVFEGIYRREANTPLGARALYWFGQSRFRQQKYLAAIDILKQVVTHSTAPDSLQAQASLAVADACFNLGNYPEALEWYRQLLEAPAASRSLRRTAHESIFECRGALGDWEAAEQALINLLADFPESQGLGEKHLQVADGYFNKSQFNNALTTYQSFLEEGHPDDPRLVRARYQMAICREKLGQNEAAADAYAALGEIEGFRHQGAVLLASGRLYLKMNNNRRALQVLELRLTLNLDPYQTALTRAHLADAYQKLDELLAARNEWEKVVAADGGAPDSLRAIGSLHLGRLSFGDRNWTGAYHGFSQADSLGISGRIYRPKYWAGEAAYRAGDTLSAVVKLEAFLAGGESESLWEATARIRLAECYEGQKRYEDALIQYRYILEMPLEGEALMTEARRRIVAIEKL